MGPCQTYGKQIQVGQFLIKNVLKCSFVESFMPFFLSRTLPNHSIDPVLTAGRAQLKLSLGQLAIR